MIVEVWFKCSTSWVYKDIINYEPSMFKFFLSTQENFGEISFYVGIEIKQNHCTKMKYSIKNFFSKCYQIHSFLRIWSHLLKRSSVENYMLCAVNCNKLVKPVSVKQVKKFEV